MAGDKSETSPSSKITREQNVNLKAKCAEAREALTKADHSEIHARYKVAVIVRELMDETKYGDNAVGRLERELGIDEKTLYRYGKVAEVWSVAEFKEVAGQLNEKRLPLTWSHLEVLAGVEDGRSRRALRARALKECLSVRALLAAIRSTPSDSAVPDARDNEATTCATIRSLDRSLAVVEREAKAMSERMLPDLGSHRETLTEGEVSQLTEALKRVDNATSLIVQLSGQVRELLFPDIPRSSAEVPAFGTMTNQTATIALVTAGTA